MTAFDERFAPFRARMEAEGLPEIAISSFAHYYGLLLSGQTGLIPESDIEPVASLPDAERLPGDLARIGKAALPKAVVIKLNGGLGTSMGLERAKSLLPVKGDLTFLDIIARQALQQDVPLMLMNSFNTRADSLPALERYPKLAEKPVPLDFLQHKVPKVRRADYTPAAFPADPDLEWAPPGHGDIYTALVTSGTLDQMLRAGYEYAFVSNADNLGATLDLTLLGYFASEGLPLMMEAADRTEADRKGGHLARLPDGQLLLRESAQCPEQDEAAFQDVARHRYFNTNSLWLNLRALQQKLDACDGMLDLPMIRNQKTVDPRDPQSTPVYQLETAMGAAIAVFAGAGAVRVPRQRFAPVKTTDDLLAVRSDAYVLTDDYTISMNPEREVGDLVVELDSRYFKLVDKMDARFPAGAPSLLACEELAIEGDFVFGEDVVVRGRVTLVNGGSEQKRVPAGTVLQEINDGS